MRAAATLVLAAGLAWGAGLAWFVHMARQAAPPPPVADGAVALTGGAGRIEAALQLLARGQARVLLISGVGGAAELPELVHRAGFDPADLAGRITLGRTATTTVGNAAETADWVRGHGVQTLIVVTAGYHMPRALTELARALPGVALFPAPVMTAAIRDASEPASLRLLATEYTKFLMAAAGLAPLFPGAHPSF